jgi:membrane protein implicated in regulation of membrane protease activity
MEWWWLLVTVLLLQLCTIYAVDRLRGSVDSARYESQRRGEYLIALLESVRRDGEGEHTK